MNKPTYHTIPKPAYNSVVQLNWEGKRAITKIRQYPKRCLQQSTHPEFHLFWGDNFHVLGSLLERYKGKVQLIYLDPPFDSHANYNRIVRLRGRNIKNKVRIQQYNDHWNHSQYLQFMYERLILLREFLSENGSIYLHADWHRIHHLRMLMDEIFGPEKLLNEIIWHHDFGGRSPHFLARKHDNILLYRKGDQWTFNIETLPDLPYKGNLHKYRGTPKKGKKPTAVWHDIQPQDFVWDLAYENKMSKQNTGYPTQKPTTLLERIIALSSNQGDLILDPFLGSGSTAVAAAAAKRHFIGIDDNWDAIHTTRTRILHQNPNINPCISSTNQFFHFRSPSEAKINHNDIIQPNNVVEKRDLMILNQEDPPDSILAHQYTDDATEYLKEFFPRTKRNQVKPAPEDFTVSWKITNGQISITKISSQLLMDKFQLTTKDFSSLDWKCFIQSIVIDFSYNGTCIQNPLIDSPLDRTVYVAGKYNIPDSHNDILLVVTDIFCREWKQVIEQDEEWKG
jgi:site-specific DNA-methyltransferase (adenine-specific)